MQQVHASRVRPPAKSALAQTFVYRAIQTYISSCIQQTVTVGVMLIEAGTRRKVNIIGPATACKNSTPLMKCAQTANNSFRAAVNVNESVIWTMIFQRDSSIHLIHQCLSIEKRECIAVHHVIFQPITSIMLKANVCHVVHECKDVQNARLQTLVKISFAKAATMPSISRTEHVSIAAIQIMPATLVTILIVSAVSIPTSLSPSSIIASDLLKLAKFQLNQGQLGPKIVSTN